MTIFIVDIIGKHSGAHYYNKSFMNLLRKQYSDVRIVSNYCEPPDPGRPVLDDYYTGNSACKIFKLLQSLLRYYFFIVRARRNCFIFLSYGNAYEILFVWPLAFCRKKIIDIHEVESLIDEGKLEHFGRKWSARFMFNRVADAVMVHSVRTNQLLDKMNHSSTRLEIPHFSYENDTDINNSLIPSEVRSLISADSINLLFFGYIRLSKGIDTVLRIADKAFGSEFGRKINIIVAGNDPDNLVRPLLKAYGHYLSGVLSILLRYIDDEELKFLFGSSDYVILPYREISQSGVLEMAVRFRKPVIASPISFFREFLKMFPSFGVLCESGDSEEYISILRKLSGMDDSAGTRYYNASDLNKFADYKDPAIFLRKLSEIVLPDLDQLQ